MERARALALIEGVLERLIEHQSEWPLSLVREVLVFGSFARGALRPGDVDLDVEFGKDWRWSTGFADALSEGRDPYLRLRRPLVGRQRGVQFVFNEHAEADFPMTPLWRRGDDLTTALKRLHEIPVDPTAGRAARHAMLPQFEGLDRWLTRFHREHFVAAIDSGAITVERLTLVEDYVDDPVLEEHLWHRWSSTSPLYRAAGAVLAYLMNRGIDPQELHLHGRSIRGGETPYYASFSLRYLRRMQWCLTGAGGREWIEVVHPVQHGDIHALRVLPVSVPKLEKLDWLRG